MWMLDAVQSVRNCQSEELTNFVKGLSELIEVLSGNLHDTMRHCGFCSVYLKTTEADAHK